jgi:hypothetical protein
MGFLREGQQRRCALVRRIWPEPLLLSLFRRPSGPACEAFKKKPANKPAVVVILQHK